MLLNGKTLFESPLKPYPLSFIEQGSIKPSILRGVKFDDTAEDKSKHGYYAYEVAIGFASHRGVLGLGLATRSAHQTHFIFIPDAAVTNLRSRTNPLMQTKTDSDGAEYQQPIIDVVWGEDGGPRYGGETSGVINVAKLVHLIMEYTGELHNMDGTRQGASLPRVTK